MSEPFVRVLARVVGRAVSEEEARRALERIRTLTEVLEDIRRGRNEMRSSNAHPPEKRDVIPAENA